MAKLLEIARRAGIQLSYSDIWGKEHNVSEATVRRLLGSLGFSAQNDEELNQVAEKLDRTHDIDFPPVRTIRAGHRFAFQVRDASLWELTDEKGGILEGVVKSSFIQLPPLNAGYYDIKIKCFDQWHSGFVIAAPAKCWLPQSIEEGKRLWGIAAQLYSLRSEKNLGIGDFGDLRQLIETSAEHGLDLIGVNPLHALFPSNAAHYSPYSPSSRLFLNFLYIDVRSVQGFDECEEAKTLFHSQDFQKAVVEARAKDLVDYQRVSEIKLQLLRILYDDFQIVQKHEEFENFCQARGEALRRQAVFDALSDYFKEKTGKAQNWDRWPSAFQVPESPEVTAFANGNAAKVDFYKWLQWIADKQLSAAQKASIKGSMALGLYRDLAVGSESGGAERWSDAGSFLPSVTVGAPPDEYNPAGQNWGLRTFNPITLKRQKFAPFIELLRANMRHCGALRIDHAFGLSRLYLIPECQKAHEGAYVDFPFEELLAILKVESHRNACLVIGEDLGTFPPNYQVGAAKAGLLSYKVLFFEKNSATEFKSPQFYAPLALATLTTHDLPTFKSWLEGNDIEEKKALSIYPSVELFRKDKDAREIDKRALKDALRRSLDAQQIEAPLQDQVQLFLAKTPCAVITLQLEDLFDVARQINMPATTEERANWQTKLPVKIETIFRDERIISIAKRITLVRKTPLVDYPSSTYRLQFHKDFTFYDAAHIVPYLAKLGISHVYASPYLQARPGSKHGYDITDYGKLNRELGGEDGYEVFYKALEDNNLKQILDFVPNHMGVGGSDNEWWLSVLEWGPQSPFATYFDITWETHQATTTPKVVLPILNDHYGNVLDTGDLKVQFDPKQGDLSLWYFQHRLNICPSDYKAVYPQLPTANSVGDGQKIKAEIAAHIAIHADIVRAVEEINRDRKRLHALLESQHYRLAFWRVASSDINYRRFFDISDLAGVRAEDHHLFDAMHSLVFSLIAKGRISGLRIDHVDGLADPAGYCRRVKEKAGAQLYLVVEKILAKEEQLPLNWPIEGTSGYDGLNLIGNVLVGPAGEQALIETYQKFTGISQSFEDLALDSKILILETTLASELQALTVVLKRVADASPYARDYPFDALKQAVKEIVGFFPVYRTYVTKEFLSDIDEKVILSSVARAKKRSWLVDASVFDFIASVLTLEDEDPSSHMLIFVRKFQQLTGPVMAKGVEDTAFYRFNQLISLNEVGGRPPGAGIAVADFHRLVRAREDRLSFSLLATATHDTKRGEDARMRLHTLSQQPHLWRQSLNHWHGLNKSKQGRDENGAAIPALNDEYFIYQTLIGSWPFELWQFPLDDGALTTFYERLEDYFVKAVREAKLHSSWNNPNTVYEDGLKHFVKEILKSSPENRFLEDLVTKVWRLAEFGMVNSLVQSVLKFTLPGIPDIYQGSEYWDLSLVDPDNRRAVDYDKRLATLIGGENDLSELLRSWQDGRVKQHLIHTLLKDRKNRTDLYKFGVYEPLIAQGNQCEHVLAFRRIFEEEELIVIVPIATSQEGNEPLILKEVFAKTYIDLPQKAYRDLLNAGTFEGGKTVLDKFQDFPVIVLSASLKG